MTRARNSANLASHGNLFVDITNDRTGIGSVVPAQNLHVAGTAGFHADVTFTGDLYNTTWDRSDNSLKFGDNSKLKFGNTEDAMHIYHDSANVNYIISPTNRQLQYKSDGGLLIRGGGNQMIANFLESAVTLYKGQGIKLTTVDHGINVTGTTDTDGLVVSGVATVTTMNVTGVLTYEDVTSVDSVGIITARQGVHIDDSITHIGDTNTRIRFPSNDAINLETGGTPRLSIDSSGNVTISGNLTVSGTTTQNNTVATSTKVFTLASGSANNAAVDGAGILIDAGSDTDKTLKWLDSTDRWTFTGGDVAANAFYGDGSNLTGIDTDLVSDTSPQLGGNLDLNGNSILLDDNEKIFIGTSNDASLFNTGSYLFLKNHNGNVAIQASGTGSVISLQKYDNSDIGLQYVVDGKIQLNYDNVSMFETESRGAFVKKADGGETLFTVGSTNAGGVRLALDGDSNGDATGFDYAYLQHNSSGDFIIAADNPSGNSNLIFCSGNSSESARIDANGGVGINTSNFSSSLNNEVGLAIHGESNDNCRIVFTTPTKSNPPSAIGYFGLNRFGVDTYDGLEIRDVTDSYATRLRIGSGGGIKINCNETYYAVNLAECNTGQLALNINKTRQGQTKGIAFGAIGSSTSHTGIQCYDTSNNSANPLLLNPFGGNIGIGYVSPRTALEVKDTHNQTANTLTPVLRLSTGNSYSGSNTGSALEFGTTNTNYPTWIKGRIGAVYNGSSNYGGHIVFHTNSGSDPVSSISEKMRITDSGKVGMGAQTSPNGTLDIRTTDDDDAIRLVNTSTGNNGIQWWNEYGGLTKRVSMDYGESDANFDIKLFRADSQDDRPYGNVRIFTGSYSSPNMNFRVTTLGTVHQPNQPAFLVRDSVFSGAFGANVYANFDTVILNRGNHYNTSNGRFTAPIAGTYLFLSLMLSQGSNRLFHEIRLNGSQVVGTRTESGTTAGQYQSNTTQAILELAKGDWVAIHVGSGGAYGGSYSNFSGYLLG